MSCPDSRVLLRDQLCPKKRVVRRSRRRENIAECAYSPPRGPAHGRLLQREHRAWDTEQRGCGGAEAGVATAKARLLLEHPLKVRVAACSELASKGPR